MFGHNYFGPGNIVSDKEPIDDDDVVALIHDWDYIKATSPIEINKADSEAIDNFIELWHKNGNWHGLFGGISLFIKKQFETIFGVQYPSMDRTTHRGHFLYANRIRNIASQYQEARRNGYRGSWRDYLRQHTTTTSTTTTPAPSTSTNNINNFGDIDFDSIDWDHFAQVENPSSSGIPMETHTIQANGEGGSSLGPGGIVGPSIHCQNDTVCETDLHFSKQRCQYSYGFINQPLFNNPADLPTRYTQITTSLALIPVDFLPFYLTSAEYSMIPEGSYVKSVSCTVEFVGLRTAFDVGTTLTGVANSEHVAIILSCIGLNKKTQGRNFLYTTTADNPMIPSGTAPLPVNKITEKWYNSWSATCMGIPRSVTGYWVIQVNDTENSAADYPVNIHGVHHLNKYLKKTYVTRSQRIKIIDYYYKPIFAPIKVKDYAPQIGKESETLEIGTFTTSLRESYNINVTGDGRSKLPKALPISAIADYDIGDWTGHYESTIKKIGFNISDGTPRNNYAQPQVHVGITPVPQLNPATEIIKFQNTAGYFDINCSIVIGIKWGSDRITNDPWANYKEAVALVQKQKYVSGATFAGWNNDGVGSLSNESSLKRRGP